MNTIYKMLFETEKKYGAMSISYIMRKLKLDFQSANEMFKKYNQFKKKNKKM